MKVCAAVGCEVRVQKRMLMCKPCWSRVPAFIQARVYQAYRRIKIDGKVNPEWVEASRDAVNSVQSKGAAMRQMRIVRGESND